MIFSKYKIILFILFITTISVSCGSSRHETSFIVKGKINLSDTNTDYTKPVFAAVTDTDNFTELIQNPADHIISIVSVDKNTLEFSIDLTGKGLKEGSIISLIAFEDKNIGNGLPNPDAGDIAGIYINPETYSAGISISRGLNTGFEINVNRKVYEFESKITGKIINDYRGDIILFAYKGNFDSINYKDININDILGYKKTIKSEEILTYSLPIMPFGFEPPIENVYILALFDSNGNGMPDSLEQIGFYANSAGYPSTIIINSDEISQININSSLKIPEPSGDKIVINGDLKLSLPYDENSQLFIIAMQNDNFENILKPDINDIKYYKKLSANTSSFSIDLSSTGLSINDKISIIALVDQDNSNDFPDPSQGDIIGYYFDVENMTQELSLKSTNEISINIDKEIYDYKADVTGSISNDYTGNVKLFAYTGSFNSLDLMQFDFHKIIGFTELQKDQETVTYKINIMPFGDDLPIDKVYIMALFDSNSNGKPDFGEELGFYTDNSDTTPSTIEITEDDNPEININSSFVLPTPSGDSITIQGKIDFDQNLGDTNPPIFIVISQAESLDDMLINPTESIKYFKKYPSDTTNFEINISQTGLKIGDKVIVTALWDKDYTYGFPSISPGDFIGYYIDTIAMSPDLSLSDTNYVELNINKEVFDYDQKCSGSVSGDYYGNVKIFAYKGDIESMNLADIDFNKVIGYKNIFKNKELIDYELSILPIGNNLPIEDVYMFALFDSNQNGKPDSGESLSYYSVNSKGLPSLIRLNNFESSGLNFNSENSFTIYPQVNEELSISGECSFPASYYESGSPAFIIIAKTENPADIFENPISVIRSFQKLPLNTSKFDIDLSYTGLKSSDKVSVAVLWDRDYKNDPDSSEYTGFPDPTINDYSGYFQNKKSFQTYLTLSDGINTVIPEGDWHFDVNRKIFNNLDNQGTRTYLKFRLQNGGGVNLQEGDQIIITAINKNGMTGSGMNMKIGDIDYVVAMDRINFTGNHFDPISIDIFPAQLDSIVSNQFDINNIYVFAILDTNKNGLPDADEKIGFYYDWLFVYIPKLTDITPGINDLSDGDDTINNRTIIFTNNTFK